MHLVGGNEDDVAGLERPIARFRSDDSASAEDEDFMFVIMAVMRGMAAGGDLELAHVEGAGPIVRADEHAHFGPVRAGHLHVSLLMLFERADFHFGLPIVDCQLPIVEWFRRFDFLAF
jgi:hypothetical protein